jgi:hypothetical protein
VIPPTPSCLVRKGGLTEGEQDLAWAGVTCGRENGQRDRKWAYERRMVSALRGFLP